MRSTCEHPFVDWEGLSNGSRHRHRCEVLHSMCFFNATLVPLHAGTPDAAKAKNLAQMLMVRNLFGSHQRYPLAKLHQMEAASPGSVADGMLQRAVRANGISTCVPLVWVPTWAWSFADSYVSSLVPLDELLSSGLIDEHVLLRPELWAWPRWKNPIYDMIGMLSNEPLLSTREEAPLCLEKLARGVLQGESHRACVARCYKRVIICQFLSTFDAYTPPMAPWRAAQRVARRVAEVPTRATGLRVGKGRRNRRARRGVTKASSKQTASAAAPPASAFDSSRTTGDAHGPTGTGVAYGEGRDRPLQVVFVNRTRTKFSRSLENLPQLLKICARWRRIPPVLCSAHEFGAAGLLNDIKAAQRADVVVGTHGAGLTNAFFMGRGGSLIEVRACRFEASLPNRHTG